jgi:CheY-like chemotaxis protein
MPRHVLVLEDNSLTADALTTYLHLEGYAARFEGDGLAALTYLAAPSEPLPEAIVLDLRMPGMDGREFLERLEAHAQWRQIPVIVITAASACEQAHLRQAHPSVKILPKPFDPDQLLDALKALDTGRSGETP